MTDEEDLRQQKIRQRYFQNEEASERGVAETYLKVSQKLMAVYWEAHGARNSEQLVQIRWKISSATAGIDIAGPEHRPISEAVSALELAWGIRKIQGGAGSAAYEKIGNLQAMGQAILKRLKDATNDPAS